MIEMRWIITNYEKRKLQYRQIIDKTMRAQPFPNMQIQTPTNQMPPIIQNWQWSEWRDVPEIAAPPAYTPPTNKCPQCGIDFTGPMGYVCTNANCPTGLGGSMS